MKGDTDFDADNFKTNSRKKGTNGRDKKRSIKKKEIKRENMYWDKEDEILLSHIQYNFDSTKSLHILINKWYHRLQDNSIVLKST